MRGVLIVAAVLSVASGICGEEGRSAKNDQVKTEKKMRGIRVRWTIEMRANDVDICRNDCLVIRVFSKSAEIEDAVARSDDDLFALLARVFDNDAFSRGIFIDTSDKNEENVFCDLVEKFCVGRSINLFSSVPVGNTFGGDSALVKQLVV